MEPQFYDGQFNDISIKWLTFYSNLQQHSDFNDIMILLPPRHIIKQGFHCILWVDNWIKNNGL